MLKRLLVRCIHCGYTWKVARPRRDERCPKCDKTGIVPLVPQ